MAKRHKITPEEITAETRLSEERRLQEAMRSAFIEATRAGVPSWHYAVGDQVYYGNNFVTVAEIYNNGLCYKVKMQEQKRESQDTRLVENILPWFKLRKRKIGTSAFTKNQDLRLNYLNIDINILLMKHLLEVSGIDLNPPYQRGYVWSEKDRESLLDSVFCGADIGKFTVRVLDTLEYMEKGVSYEIIDGKQRFMTLLDYYLNRFPYKGTFFSELSANDQRTFLNHNVSWCELKNISQEDTLRVFLLVNRGGHAVSDDVINRAEALLSSLQKDKSQK